MTPSPLESTADASIDDLTIKGGDGVDTIDVGATVQPPNDDVFVAGNDGSDTITGSVAVTAITLAGGTGDDTINSGAGTTTAIGGLGRDTMQAGAAVPTCTSTPLRDKQVLHPVQPPPLLSVDGDIINDISPSVKTSSLSMATPWSAAAAHLRDRCC